MPDRNKVQAMFPATSTPIENTCGTAPGIAARLNDADIYVTPGVPREMKTMFDNYIWPRLTGQGAGNILASRHIHCFGAGESTIGEMIHDLMQPGMTPTVGTRVKDGLITVRITAQSPVPDPMSGEFIRYTVSSDVFLRKSL